MKENPTAVVISNAPTPERGLEDLLNQLCFWEQLDALRQKAARSARMPLEAADVSTAPPPEDISRILLVHDKLDPIVPIDDATETLTNWPAARLVTTQGYGHYRLMKNPDVIRYVTEFLRHE